MSNDKMREEFEGSPKFRGMDFTRSSTHSQFYESAYANGAWDGWKASREALVIELPGEVDFSASDDAYFIIGRCQEAIEAAGVRCKS